MQPLWCSSKAKEISLSCANSWFKGTIKTLHGSGTLGLRGLGFTTLRVAPRVDHLAGRFAGGVPCGLGQRVLGKRASPAP